MVFTYKSLILNGIRSVEPIDLGSLKCFEALLKCNYSECKRRFHRIFIDVLIEGRLATYELLERPDGSLARIYVKHANTLNDIKERIDDILKGDIKSVGNRIPSYLATEVFFDLLVDAAFRKSGFKYIRGKGKVLDPSDLSKYVRKRTIIEVTSDGNEKYYGILFIDYGIISRSSLADRLFEELGIDDFVDLKDNEELRRKCLEIANSYIGSSVLTLRKRGNKYEYMYGEITGIEPIFSHEKTLPNGQTIYDLWIRRFHEDEVVKRFVEAEPSRWEYPLFKVRIKGYNEELTYPPSLLRVFEVVERPDPSTRWDNIRRIMRIVEENIKRIYKDLIGKDIKFKYIKYALDSDNVGIRLNFYTGSDNEKSFRKYTVKLKYRDNKGKERDSLASPLFMFSRGFIPYSGKCELSLIVIYPSTLKSEELNRFLNYLSLLFKELNFGSIRDHKYHSYRYDPANLSESLTSLENTIQRVLKSYSRSRHLPLIIIPDNEKFYKSSKEIASNNGFHSQLVTLETFSDGIEYINKIEDRNLTDKIRRRLEEALKSLVANICGGIYVEFLIQKSIAKGNVSGPLTWILAKPADQKGESMYVGLDVSTKRGVIGAAFILLNPYGELIDARIIPLKSETLDYQDYYDVLRYMVSKARDEGLRRIVVLRDGIPRSPKELKDCLDAYVNIVRELGYNVSLDYVAVIKRSSVRAFASNKAIKINPIQGTYACMYKLKHLGYYAHEILVVASKPEESEEEISGTVKPVILRVYELQRGYNKDDVKRIAEEYLALTRLNFWNLRTGAHKLALPVKMADTLAYMLSMGIPIRVK